MYENKNFVHDSCPKYNINVLDREVSITRVNVAFIGHFFQKFSRLDFQSGVALQWEC